MLYNNLVIARSGLSLSFFLGSFTLIVTKKIGRVARKYGYHFQRHFLALQWQRAWNCCCRVLPAFITTFKTLCKRVSWPYFEQQHFNESQWNLMQKQFLRTWGFPWSIKIDAIYERFPKANVPEPLLIVAVQHTVIHEWWSWLMMLHHSDIVLLILSLS